MSDEQPQDFSMEILFCKELKDIAAQLREQIALQEKEYSPKRYDAIFPILKAVYGSSKLNKLNNLAKRSRQISDAIEKVKATGGKPPKAFFDEINAFAALLEELSALDPAKLAERVAKIGSKEEVVPPPTHPQAVPSPVKEAAKEIAKGPILDASMMEMFLTELETQTAQLTQSLIDYEEGIQPKISLESLMRASHSVKGAARVVGINSLVSLAHAMEDCFVKAQEGALELNGDDIDRLLECVDLLGNLSKSKPETLQDALDSAASNFERLTALLTARAAGAKVEAPPAAPAAAKAPPPSAADIPEKPKKRPQPSEPKKKVEEIEPEMKDRILRVTAQNLNRLMGLAGESLVESRWLIPFGESLTKVKKGLYDVSILTDGVALATTGGTLDEKTERYIRDLQSQVNETRQQVNNRLSDLDLFIIRHSSLSDRLYREVIESRMRPFSDGVQGFPRMVRDLARQLNKNVKLQIIGKNTPVDREILEKLEAPLSHLLRNAIDHGIESQEERVREGKNPEGTIILEAQHRAGMLAITVTDDGRGLDVEGLRKKIVEKNMSSESMAASMSESELLEFLFLPGFSTAKNVTEISGRGVGLNVVQTMLQEVSGNVRVTNRPGKGMTFNLLLPLTLSVIRALLVEISGEPYAFPLSRIDHSILIPSSEIEAVESRQYFKFQGKNIGVIPASQVLEYEERGHSRAHIPIIILSDHISTYGIVVDKFLGERELVVHELDPHLGKIPNISSGALMEDGSPLLIIDVEDMVRSIDSILSTGSLHKLKYEVESGKVKGKKRVLVVDDSITVREVECRLLANQGYEVQGAVNGMDAWNALRLGNYDLVVTDVDMPRMNGIELIKQIRSDAKMKHLPVMIVSYKEREEDRVLGMEAGANYYLIKSGFHDEALLKAVFDLIGPPQG